TINLGDQLWFVGDLDEALAIAAQVAEHAEAAENGWMLLRSRFLEALVLTLRGQAGRMSGTLGWLEERAHGTGHPPQRRAALATLALLHAALGDFEAATRLVRTIAEQRNAFPLGPLVRAAIAVGELEGAEALADTAPGESGLLARGAVAEAHG